MRKASYTNHLGITVEFNNPYSFFTLNPLPLRTYEATATVMSEKITGFSEKGIKNYGIELGITGRSAAEASENYDHLMSVFETDTISAIPGTITVNGYSLKCFISGIAPQASLRRAKTVIATVTTDNALWYRELFTAKFAYDNFTIVENSPTTYPELTYPHDYPVGYSPENTIKEINNPAMRPSHFRLIVEGSAESPAIIIGGHTYSVDVSVPLGSRLIIDSRASTIVLSDEKENTTNAFDRRNRYSDIFAKIPTGRNKVSFGSSVDCFYLTLIDERSYPQWST